MGLSGMGWPRLQLIEIINKGRSSSMMVYREKSKYFSQSVGTDYDFNVQGHVLNVIDQFLISQE